MVTVIIVGLDYWKKYTAPMIESIQKNDPDLNIVCVDNGTRRKYPQVNGVTMIRSDKKLSYPAGLNIGLREAPASDWYLICNNDLRFRKKITGRIEKLPTNALYGFELYPKIFSMPYMPSWCFFISHDILTIVGMFDEKFAPMWFEDADYCFRCIKAGYELKVLDRKNWGIHHLEDEKMTERKAYMQKNITDRQRNRAYLRAKHGL